MSKRTVEERRAAIKALDERRAKAGPGHDRAMYGAPVSIDKMVWARSNGGWSGNEPRPQRYPSGCRRLFRLNGIKPYEAEKGKIPEACR